MVAYCFGQNKRQVDFDVNNVQRRGLVIFYSYIALYKSYNYYDHELENKRIAVGFCGLHIVLDYH